MGTLMVVEVVVKGGGVWTRDLTFGRLGCEIRGLEVVLAARTLQR